MFDAFIFGHSGDQDDELVAPETAAQIICPAGFPQAAGEELEDPVSVGVPEVVIHVFKVVEIGKGEAENGNPDRIPLRGGVRSWPI